MKKGSQTTKKKILALFLAMTMMLSNLQLVAASPEVTEGSEKSGEVIDEIAVEGAMEGVRPEAESGLPEEEQTAVPEGVITISSSSELAKIGADSQYPMNGDYMLAADIDLTGIDWKPLGGYTGNKGTVDASEANVFSGTFDGAGHVISGLTINLSGSINQYGSGRYGQVGLFSVVAGNSENNYAEVKNLIFTDVNIQADFTDGLAAIGTLAGEVNGYAKVENVAVLGGKLVVNRSALCDTVGAGGLIGECRTADAMGNNNVTICNCYNGAEVVASGTRSDLPYAAGIVGRIAQSACKEISGCVNVGSVQFDGYDGYGIAAAANGNTSFLTTVADCYYLDSTGQSPTDGATAMEEKELKSGELPGNLSSNVWSAVSGCYPVPSICYESSAAGYVYLSGLKLGFASGEGASGVKTTVTLPATLGNDTVTWSSSNEKVLAVVGNEAVADTEVIGTDTTVELTASCGGFTRSFKLIVLTSKEQKASFDQNYAQVGVPLTVSVSNVEGMDFTYVWTIGGTTISNKTDTYTPTENDLEKFITVQITAADNSAQWNLMTYCSELPVVYVDTEDGKEITSNTVEKDATIKIQGNAEFNDPKTYYDGETKIKGRGNSTWSQAVAWGVKKPYKLKLSSKSNLLGLGEHGNGKNKHWVLLANMIDHTNMRNEIVNNFSRDIGMETSMGTTNVVLILNGEYQGIYQLCEHVRVGSARVDVFDWEDLADEIADAICAGNSALDVDTMEEAMEQDYSWVTTGVFNYGGQSYQISDYYSDEIPEFTGGFLLDMDFRSTSDAYKYVSTFQTSNGIPMFFRRPEYAKTNSVMINYARDYLNAYEAALNSNDFTTTYQDETVHYTDLFDMDSLVQYWYVCELTNNWDSMKNSTYLYKDLTGKAKMGPAWDYDWAFGNINMYSMSQVFVVDNWHTTLCGSTFAEQTYQKSQWNRFLVKDPYFVTKAYEYWQKYRSTVLEDLVKDGGVIDTLKAKYQTASEANDDKWSYSYGWYRGTAYVNGVQTSGVTSQTYDDAVASLKMFIIKRLEWMDKQFASVETLYKSLGNTVSTQISAAADTSAAGNTVLTANVSNSNVKYVEFLVNGTAVTLENGSKLIPVNGGKATVTIPDSMLSSENDAINTAEVLGVNASQGYVSGVMNFVNFTKELAPSADLTGTVSIKGNAVENNVLKAVLEESNNSGKLSYQWYADGTAIEGADSALYLLTAAEIGKVITVTVKSSSETGMLEAAPTDTVTAKVMDAGEAKSGLIINQVYAGGAAGDTPVTHDYIEIFNNSYKDVDLNGYQIGYLSNRDAKKKGSTSGELVKLDLSGTIKAHTSYLIRCAENEVASYEDESKLPMSIEKFDLEWDRVLDNKQYQIILYDGEGSVLDAVSVGEEDSVNADITDMVRLEADFVSKQKILGRLDFGNYVAITLYDSKNDIPQILTQDGLDAVRPHTGDEGIWSDYDWPTPTEPPTPTDTPMPTDSPSPTDTPTPTDSPSPTDTPTPTDSPSPTDTPMPTDSPSPTDTPMPTDSPSPTDTPMPTDSPSPTDTPMPTEPPTPTNSPVPSNTPTPGATKPAHESHVGKTFVTGGLKYKVTKDDEAGREVRVTSMKSNAKILKIPATATNAKWKENFKVTSVKAKAFKGKNITKAVIGKNVIKIGPNAFKGCTKLENAVLGKNVKNIGIRAFYGCKNLKKVTVKGNALKTVKKNAFKRISQKAVIKVPKSKKKAYTRILRGKIAKGVTIK